MKGNPDVIAQLQHLLNGELAARDQYFIHSRRYLDWGYTKLYERLNHEMEEETGHADMLINRMLFLEATPDLSNPDKFTPGEDVPGMLKADLALEYSVAENLRKAIKVCEDALDYDTRRMLLIQLKDTEEDHAHWLEQQLRLIDMLGLPLYLQQQM
ncbi:bacterioferritin [Granulosicoccaceae sp. 1_MG-2023]|nr:bacterioferritin [Granulosicoccaceae sp. 1_MG-2023]